MSLSGNNSSNKLFPSPAIAPCRLACPINQNVQEYIACIAESRFPDAAAVIRRTNPFPSVCGRLCPHPCELECSRSAIDGSGPVAIRELKRFTADLETEAIENDFPVFEQTHDQKTAVIGAGPAGLTAAFDLRKLGYSVTVFESMPFAGGLLALSCTPQVLPLEILAKDIEAIRTAGVDIKTNTTLGKDPSIQDLRRLGFAAILIATGAGRVLLQGGLEQAKELRGFLEPSDWLRGRKQEKAPGLEGKKVVIDGVTSWSVHWAMLAAADGAKSVTLLTHLPAAHLPVEKQYMKMAKAAGVRLMALHGPERIVSTSGAISGVELRKYKVDGSDPRGRVRLKKAARRRKMIAAQIFIPTGPSVFDAAAFEGDENIETTLRGSLIVDPETMLVSPDGIFAAGDAVTGTRSIIETIASGRRAAANIHCFLSGEKTLPVAVGPGAAAELGEKKVALTFRDISPLKPQLAPAIDRSAAFSADRGKRKRAVRTKEEAIAEARKCLRCAACVECDTCHPFCRWSLHTGPSGAGGVPGDIFRVDAAPGSPLDGSAGGLMNVQPLRAHVNEHLCDGCGRCEPACPYRVINTAPRRSSETGGPAGIEIEPEMAFIDPEICRACGLCAAVCPTRAITFEGFSPENVVESIQKIAPHPVTLKCAWSDGSKRRQESEIKVGCLGQVPPAVYLKAMEAGCSGVLALGCGPDACHHKAGFDQARRAIDDIKMVLAMAGINPRRIQIAAGGSRRADALEKLRSLKPLNDRGREKAPELRRFMMEPSPSIEIRSAALVQARYARPDTVAAAEGEGVLHFPGCLAAALQLSGDARPGLLRSFRCCGLEFLRAGENAKFSEIAASNIEHFTARGAHTVVVSCTDCLHCFKTHYGAVEKPENLKFIHLLEFLKQGGGLPAPGGGPVEPQLRRKVAFLPSHHNTAEDRLVVDFLGDLPGIELVSHGRGGAAAACCGVSGWKTSGRDAKRVQLETLAAARERGAEIIVTAGSSCFYHLQKIHCAGSWRLQDIEIEPLEVFIKGLARKTP